MADYAHKKDEDAALLGNGDGQALRNAATQDGEERADLLSTSVPVPFGGAGTSTVSAVPATAESTLPLLQSLGLAATYSLTSMFFFLLIRYSKKKQLVYNNAIAVFFIETTKLAVSVALKYREDGEFLPATLLCSPNRRTLWREGLPYAVPSFLYAVYNNLTFFNLNVFDPGTYQVFMQTRILFTGIFFSILLKRDLTLRKWVALVLLMIGVASKYLSPHTLQIDGYILFVLLQSLLSSTAGVYNEYAFKKGRHLSIHQQNFFMYLYALFFNAVFGIIADPSILTSRVFAASGAITTTTTTIMVTPTSEGANTYDEPARIGILLFLSIVFFGAVTGLSAAFILKFINVIVKAFASAIEILLTAVMSAVLLGDALTGQDVVAACIVMSSVGLYYTQGLGDQSLITCWR
ncbi:putative nucleotide sugar transporter [Leptomonas seymouri]|uniref:Putative nucleotide sugar transporter n=1 Tax=Leptomonas seymouri TaxID=5684 RepID=A0A0N0P6R3_LEPSE|nr:putative nucleotide sugar transporter [Leptomonas seymouri]|eukprot:KPI87467.1 putative nucleotide sugar transporter [Leptomonas seymouri]